MRLIKCLSVMTFVAAMTIALAGCDSSSSSAGGSDMDELAARLAKPEPAPAPVVATPAPEPTPPPVAETPAATAPENETSITITVKNPQGLLSQVGGTVIENPQTGQPEKAGAPLQAVDTKGVVGKKQRRNRVEGPLQYYGAISNVRVLAEDRAIGWQIQKSMDLFVNTHDGKYPKTTEEYMKEIIEPNMIVLPELPPGQEYFYDPADHQLKIGELVDEPAAPSTAQ